jgi:hypothetical protein
MEIWLMQWLAEKEDRKGGKLLEGHIRRCGASNLVE